MNTSLENEIRDALFGVTASGTAVDDALREIMEIVDRRRPARLNDYQLHGRREDTQTYEIHSLTPKPLSEQVSGAWNFVEQQSGHCPCGSGRRTTGKTCFECRR